MQDFVEWPRMLTWSHLELKIDILPMGKHSDGSEATDARFLEEADDFVLDAVVQSSLAVWQRGCRIRSELI